MKRALVRRAMFESHRDPRNALPAGERAVVVPQLGPSFARASSYHRGSGSRVLRPALIILSMFGLVGFAACSSNTPFEPTRVDESSASDAGHAEPADASVSRDAATAQAPSSEEAGSPRPPTVVDGGAGDAGTNGRMFTWDLPPGFPVPAVPEDNPMSEAKVRLGRHLFYDKRLSSTQTASCATCHEQRRAFTDGRTVSTGVTGEHTPRNSMSLANVAYASTLTWANPLQTGLERQALVPMFGTNPIELGLGEAAELEARLRAVPLYVELFAAAFPGEADPITTNHVTAALASFERTLISGRSAFDRYLYDHEASALSEEAARGYQLFNSERLECFHCHVGFNLTDHVTYEGKPFIDRPYHNTGLYNIDGDGAYPEPNTGVLAVTGEARDMGRFKAPSLRNVAVTGPYMHDGSIETLSEVLEHYASGGRTITSGPNAGDGSKSPLKSTLLVGFTLTEDERRDVLAFLESLTDEVFLTDERFGDPWPAAEADSGTP